MEKKSIEDLSNLVFGLALTLGALTLVPPKKDDFGQLLTILLNFALSFLIIVWIWWGYNSLTKRMTMEGRTKYSLNILLLFLVVIEPYLLTIVNYESGATAYAIDVGVTLLILAAFNQFILDETSFSSEEIRRGWVRRRNVMILCALVFFLSIIAGMVSDPRGRGVQELIWLSVLVLAVSTRVRGGN